MVATLISRSKSFFQSEHKSILSAAFVIGASYLASALLGLVRNHLLAARFFGGLEADLDVYFAAFVIPDTIFQLLVVGAISAAFIPIFQETVRVSREKAYELTNVALTSLSLILFFFTVILFIFARPVADLLAHYPPDKLSLMANLIRIMSIAQLLFTFSAFVTGILQAQRRFLIPALAPLLYNFGTILGIFFLSSSLGIYAAAAGVVFGALLHFLVQLPLARHLGYLPRFHFVPDHPGVRTMLRLMPPRTLALSLNQIERWVAVNLTSLLAAGSLSIFNFARQLYFLPIALFGVSLSQASFPSLADDAAKKDLVEFKFTLRKTVLQIFFFALPASVLILVLRIPLVRLAYGARAFPWEATLLTAKTLAILTVSIAPQAVAHALTRAFHALKNTRTPLYVSTFSIIVFILISYFSTRTFGWGLLGIATAITLGSLLDLFLLYLLLIRRIGHLSVSIKIAKMIVASAFTGVALWLPMRLLDQFVFDTTRTLPLIALTLMVSFVGGSVYLLFSFLMKIEQLVEVWSLVKRLGNWQRILGQTDEVLETGANQ